MAIDPICKMEVDESTAEFTSKYKGKKYYVLLCHIAPPNYYNIKITRRFLNPNHC